MLSGMLQIAGFRDRDIHHGEIIAWFTIIQLLLENQPKPLIQEVIGFCNEVGLPITLNDSRLKSVGVEMISAGIQAAFTPESTVHNVPFSIDAQMVNQAMLEADALGQCLVG